MKWKDAMSHLFHDESHMMVRRIEFGAEKNRIFGRGFNGAWEAFGQRSVKGVLSTSGGPQECS